MVKSSKCQRTIHLLVYEFDFVLVFRSNCATFLPCCTSYDFEPNSHRPLYDIFLISQHRTFLPFVSAYFSLYLQPFPNNYSCYSMISLMALFYYLRSAWTNPGFLIGDASDVAKKAGAYDAKMYAIDAHNDTVDMSAAG